MDNTTIYFVAAPPIKGRIENKISTHIFNNLKNKNKKWIFGLETEVEPKDFKFYDIDVWVEHQIKIIKNIKEIKFNNEDVIFFSDFWFPGLDLIKLYLDSLNIKIYYSSFLHGASFVEGDLMSNSWCSHIENAWMDIYDSILIQTEYSRTNIRNNAHFEKCVIVGSPFNSNQYTNNEIKKYDIIWPHRLSEDKGFTEFLNLLDYLTQYKVIVTVPFSKNTKNDNIELLKTKNVTISFDSKNEVHKTNISSAKIVLSTAKQETWGYAVMESVAAGAIPIVPNKACYPYLYSDMFRYNSLEECIQLIKKYIDSNVLPPKIDNHDIVGYFNKGKYICVQ